MEIWQVAVLGIIQGASEFLPISSTAHLILTPYFFGWSDLGLSFDVALHLGTLLAVLFYFWGDWGAILRDRKLVSLLILATLPAIFGGFLFEEQAETVFRAPLFVALNLAIFGLLLGMVDILGKKSKDLASLGKVGAVVVGLFQAISILPGISRSGATMTGGLFLGLKREVAVKFSFLLSAPIILASVVWQGRKLLNGAVNGGHLDLWLLGILVSFISGFLAIKFLLNFVKSNSLWPFVIYRLILAAVVVFTLLARG